MSPGRMVAALAAVLVGFGSRVELWSAGATPHWRYPRWPPPDVPPLIPRAVPPEEWRRVGGAGSELMWSVTIRLAPSDVFVDGDVNDDRERWDVAVASAAAVGRLAWDRELLDGFLDDAAHALASGTSGGHGDPPLRGRLDPSFLHRDSSLAGRRAPPISTAQGVRSRACQEPT